MATRDEYLEHMRNLRPARPSEPLYLWSFVRGLGEVAAFIEDFRSGPAPWRRDLRALRRANERSGGAFFGPAAEHFGPDSARLLAGGWLLLERYRNQPGGPAWVLRRFNRDGSAGSHIPFYDTEGAAIAAAAAAVDGAEAAS